MYILGNCTPHHCCLLVHIRPLCCLFCPPPNSPSNLFFEPWFPSVAQDHLECLIVLALPLWVLGMLPHKTSLTSFIEPCHCCMKVHFKGWSFLLQGRGGKGGRRGKERRRWRKERKEGRKRKKGEKEKAVLNSHFHCQKSNIQSIPEISLDFFCRLYLTMIAWLICNCGLSHHPWKCQ